MRTNLKRTAGLASVALAASVLVSSPAAPASYPGMNGWIAYQSDGDVFVMDPVAGTILNLTKGATNDVTNDPAQDGNPQWSPDGTKLLFNSDSGGGFDIWMLDLAGNKPSKPEKVGGTDGLDYDPTWCGNNTIVYMSDYDADGETDETDFEIWRQNLGASPEQITDNQVYDGYPNCSPDQQIAFGRNVAQNNTDLFVYDLGTGIETPLVQAPGNQGFASWYPDGSALVYVHTPTPNDDADVYRVQADGSNPTGLVMTENDDWDPVVSPDGSTLAFGYSSQLATAILPMDPNDEISDFSVLPIVGQTFSADWQPVGENTVFGHQRVVTLEVDKGKKDSIVSGRVRVKDAFDRCLDKVKLKLKVKKRGKYRTIKKIRSRANGEYQTEILTSRILDRPLRVFAPELILDAGNGSPLKHKCLKASAN